MLNTDFDQKLSLILTDMSSKDNSKSKLVENYCIEQSQFLTTFQREFLLKSIKADLRPEYRRRIEIMLLADMGYSQAQICTALGCSQEMARYWITMAQTGQAHNWNNRPLGRPNTINAQYIERLKELVSHSPAKYGYSFRRWTAEALSKHLAKEFDIKFSDRHINRLLNKLGLSTRQRRSSAKGITNGTKDSGITIGELTSSSSPSFLWSFNLLTTNN